MNLPRDDAVLVFDIETIPDTAGARRLYQLDASLSDDEVVAFLQRERRELTGRELMPVYLNRVLVISCCLRWQEDRIFIKSLGAAGDSEALILEKFFAVISQYRPRLVSWNGGGFDLPVLQHRSLINKVAAPAYWDMGQLNPQMKWDNYINRYQFKHLDLMDVLALYQNKSFAPLDKMAQLCGFPGKLGFSGAEVWDAYNNGREEEVRAYCETDVMNTYLLFLRFQLCRGWLTTAAYEQEVNLLSEFLRQDGRKSWQEFLAALADT